jgi:NADH-quinone oxidoreductase subunit H
LIYLKQAELVSGYNVEYSASGFALFFLGEYSNILLMGAVISILFLGGWFPILGLGIIPSFFWLPIKIIIISYIFIIIIGVLPRYRYDQLMDIGWKVFIPITLGWLVLISSILISFNMLPNFIQL